MLELGLHTGILLTCCRSFCLFQTTRSIFIAAQTGEELHLDRGQYLLAGTTCPQQSDKPDGGGAGIVRVYAGVKGTHAQGL